MNATVNYKPGDTITVDVINRLDPLWGTQLEAVVTEIREVPRSGIVEIGNAVPPLLAEAVLRAVLDA